MLHHVPEEMADVYGADLSFDIDNMSYEVKDPRERFSQLHPTFHTLRRLVNGCLRHILEITRHSS